MSKNTKERSADDLNLDELILFLLKKLTFIIIIIIYDLIIDFSLFMLLRVGYRF